MISIIVAIAKNNVIGGDNTLLWHISEDLKRFKKITTGSTLIMGRKTFQSLPGILPNRKHIVITRDKDFTVDSDMVVVVNSIEDILSKYSNTKEEVFIIGGGEIYTQFLPHADKLYLTLLNKEFIGDTKFPEIDYSQWKLVNDISGNLDEKSNITFDFKDFVRNH